MSRHTLLVAKAQEVLHSLQDWARVTLELRDNEELRVTLEIQQLQIIRKPLVNATVTSSGKVPVGKGKRLYPIFDSQLSLEDWQNIRRALSSRGRLLMVVEHFERSGNKPVSTAELESLFQDAFKGANDLNSALREAGLMIGLKPATFGEKFGSRGPCRFYHLSAQKLR